MFGLRLRIFLFEGYNKEAILRFFSVSISRQKERWNQREVWRLQLDYNNNKMFTKNKKEANEKFVQFGFSSVAITVISGFDT